MPYTVYLTAEARDSRDAIFSSDVSRAKKIKKALNLLKENPRHPGLHTHEFHNHTGANGEKLFIGYVENNTPRAYRIVFYYACDKHGKAPALAKRGLFDGQSDPD
ncbi:MAG: hypothetical protein ACLQVD_01965 [Capsulimonadaceae bacterium]